VPILTLFSVTTVSYVESTSYCPITETSTLSGKVVTVVYTSTSLIWKAVPTTIVVYATGKPTTVAITTEIYVTSTSLCPVTLTTTIAGKAVTQTYYETSVIVVTKPYTIWTTYEPPTTKATVIIPSTKLVSAAVTAVTTIPSDKTATSYGQVESTIIYTVVKTATGAPAGTTVISTKVTSIAVTSTPTTTTSSGPIQVTSNAAVVAKGQGNGAAAFAGAIAIVAALI
jgi:hypothetical protein